MPYSYQDEKLRKYDQTKYKIEGYHQSESIPFSKKDVSLHLPTLSEATPAAISGFLNGITLTSRHAVVAPTPGLGAGPGPDGVIRSGIPGYVVI